MGPLKGKIGSCKIEGLVSLFSTCWPIVNHMPGFVGLLQEASLPLKLSACCSTDSRTIFQKQSDTARLRFLVVTWCAFSILVLQESRASVSEWQRSAYCTLRCPGTFCSGKWGTWPVQQAGTRHMCYWALEAWLVWLSDGCCPTKRWPVWSVHMTSEHHSGQHSSTGSSLPFLKGILDYLQGCPSFLLYQYGASMLVYFQKLRRNFQGNSEMAVLVPLFWFVVQCLIFCQFLPGSTQEHPVVTSHSNFFYYRRNAHTYLK